MRMHNFSLCKRILTVIRAIIRHPEFTKHHWADSDSGQVEGLTQLTLAGPVSYYSKIRMQVRPPLVSVAQHVN